MEKILDRYETTNKIKLKYTFFVILFTNVILIGIIFLLLEYNNGIIELIIAGIGMVAIVFINLIIAVIIGLFTDSKEWKKWGVASILAFLGSMGIIFSSYF